MGEEQNQVDDIQEEKIDLPKVGSALQALAMIGQGIKYLHKNAWKQTLAFYLLVAFVIWIVTNNLDQFGVFAKQIVSVFSNLGQ